MIKNSYQILQDWYKLLETGVITEEEFIDKKNQLLNEETKGFSTEDNSIDVQKESAKNNTQQLSSKHNITTQAQQYESWLIVGLIVIIAIIAAWYFK